MSIDTQIVKGECIQKQHFCIHLKAGCIQNKKLIAYLAKNRELSSTAYRALDVSGAA